MSKAERVVKSRSESEGALRSAPSSTPQAALQTCGLAVYDTRSDDDGDVWSPECGALNIPAGWVFLPRGDAFVTRKAKQGPHWVLMGCYNRRGGYRPVHGVYAPANAIAAAQEEAAATNAARTRQREKARKHRERKEQDYQQRFEQACLEFVNFDAAHEELAREIALSAAQQACEVSSGRVGRTSRLSLARKAELAVRATIRHEHTDYEDQLADCEGFAMFVEDAYLDLKAQKGSEVDDFLEKHRARPSSRRRRVAGRGRQE